MTAAGVGLWAAITIAVAGPATSPEYLPVHLAQAGGYFVQEQLQVTLKVERSEGDAALALARGRADIGYEALRGFLEAHLPGDPALFNEFHALLVAVAKSHCRARPRCEGCPLRFALRGRRPRG